MLVLNRLPIKSIISIDHGGIQTQNTEAEQIPQGIPFSDVLTVLPVYHPDQYTFTSTEIVRSVGGVTDCSGGGEGGSDGIEQCGSGL